MPHRPTGRSFDSSHQFTAFLVLWAGHAALTDVDALMSLGELIASDIIALLTEGFIYVFVAWALLAPLIHRLRHGTFKGTGMDALLLASGAGFVLRVLATVVTLSDPAAVVRGAPR